jgi:hypothetical protein
MTARKFFYICAALLCLSLAFHFGYTTAKAQAPGNPVVGVGIAATQSLYGVAVTANGDVYTTGPAGFTNWHLTTNLFTGGPTPALQESWGQLKSRYAPSHAPTSQIPTNR